jgi:hypothetical protein
MNIYERLMNATAELQTVAKNLIVETGNGKGYKAVSERDILDAVKPIEKKHGIYSFPVAREIVESDRLEKTSSYKGETRTTTSFYIRLKTTYRFVNIEDPKEYVDMVTYSTGLDSGDKGEGKAMTYGDKYALMKAYKISTGEDPDQSASEDAQYGEQKVTNANVRALRMRLEGKNVTEEQIATHYGVAKIEDLTISQWTNAMRKLEATK